MNTLELLRAAVAAKVAYWNAIRALEVATRKEGEDDWSDKASDKATDMIDNLAVECDSPEDVEHIGQDNVADLLAELKSR